jgi:hypothetical protein
MAAGLSYTTGDRNCIRLEAFQAVSMPSFIPSLRFSMVLLFIALIMEFPPKIETVRKAPIPGTLRSGIPGDSEDFCI